MEATTLSPIELLQFYIDVGADEAIADQPIDRFSIKENQGVVTFQGTNASTETVVPVADAPVGSFEAMPEAIALAAAANSLDELKAALDGFKGLALKRTSTQMVFADGNPNAKIMLIGDVAGTDEDRLGRPFAGLGGQLFDKMMAAIGLSREHTIYISNIINWRPPGGRTPTDAEFALSLPFAKRHIELVNPDILIYVGGVAAKELLQTKQSINKLRGRWIDYQTPSLAKPILSMAILHPQYLLQTPAEKAQAWADLLRLKAKLQELELLPRQ